MNRHSKINGAKAKREKALARGELRGPTEARTFAGASITGLALKVVDPALRRMIDEALARKARNRPPA